MVTLVVVVLAVHGTTVETSDSNEITASPSPMDLASNLRTALLKALTELENEDSGNRDDKLVERAPASSFTFFDNSESDGNISSEIQSSIFTTITPPEITSPSITNQITARTNLREIDPPLVILQKSEGVQEKTITTFEKENSEIDSNDVEQIITSASKSFTPSDNQLVTSIVNEKFSNINTNLIPIRDKIIVNPSIISTTIQPATSTEENEAKVENVQFFSAPLVAAFTVHQDESGLPKKVESIFRQELPTKVDTYFSKNKLILEEQQKLEELRRQKIIRQQNEKIVKQEKEVIRQQNEKLVKQEQLKLEELKQQELFQRQNEQNILRINENLKNQQEQSQQQHIQKQKALEHEILRLNSNLKKQNEVFLMQQEQFRLRNNLQYFLPIANTGPKRVIQNTLQLQQLSSMLPSRVIEPLTISEPLLTSQQLPVKSAELFNPSVIFSKNAVSVLPSITFDPLVEAGKLPINAQILPVKAPINFHSPFIQTPKFQQFHSLSPSIVNLNQLQFLQPLPQPQSNRIFRQENSIGNFLNNKNSDTVFIQQSIQPPPFFNNIPGFFPQNNRFFRSNKDTNSQPALLQQPPQKQQSNRVFRSNPESTLTSPNNFYRHQQKNYQLNNLLYNSGALRGSSSEDFNIVAKVLALNHSGDQRYANSVRQEQRIPYYRTV